MSSSSSSSSAVDDEADAFLAWAQTVVPLMTLTSLHDLCDGVVLFAILAEIDAQLFRNPHSGADTKDNWVLTIGTLKRLYKLMMQFYTQTLECSPTHLPAPDLNAIARSADKHELCKLCLLAIGIAVQSEKNDVHISAIQTLDQTHQHQLMMSIERIITSIKLGQEEQLLEAADQSKASIDSRSALELEDELIQLQSEKDTAQQAYLQMVENQRTLQSQLDDERTEKKELLLKHAVYKKQIEEERDEQADVLLRQEIDKLRHDLQRTEDIVSELESDNEQHVSTNTDLQHRLDNLQAQVQDAAKLNDQLDEYRHAAEKLHRAENVIEKHKKKLEEAADLRRQFKLVEEQNTELVGRNASLEEDYQRVSGYKSLMDSYKTQMADLEAKASSLQRELATATYQQEQLASRLKASEDQRLQEKEEAELYQERIKELELGGGHTIRNASDNRQSLLDDDDRASSDEAEVDTSRELEEALSETSMASLKIKVRKLTRELEIAGKGQADTSRLLVLENLLQDAQRTKARYESDYLREHKHTLVLQHQLEAIRSGKSDLGDGQEAAYALRIRLNEVTQELDTCNRDRNQLEVVNEQLGRQLATAQSDLSLVNKDQVDILHSLRASLNGETDELQTALSKSRAELSSALEQNKMYMAQVNTLLVEKVDLQAEGIGQRDEAIKRERALGELHSRLKGQSLPREVEEMVSTLQQEAIAATRDLGAVQDKLTKAKTFIKQQDKMIKDKERSSAPSPSTFAVTEGDVQPELRSMREQVRNLQREQNLMMSAFQDLGRRYMIELESGRNSGSGAGTYNSHGAGSSWLANQRHMVNPTLQLASRR